MKPEVSQTNLNALYRAIEKQEIAIVEGKLVRVRHWKIIRLLGEGSSAVVYLGHSLLDENERVAIKVFKKEYIRDEKVNEANLKMLRTEAALVGKINHPNILQTYSVGLSPNFKYLVMEVVDGGCLEDFVNPPKNLSLSELINVFFQCGAGFQYSDEIGVIHRDVKPDNILFSKGVPKITDFGSSMVKGMDELTVKGVGSPSYMSSEQIRQAPLNQQTDIYSLGASFFEMITGQRTFVADNAKDMAYKILYVDPPPISQFVSSRLPDGLDDIIAKCLKKDQQERYANWGAFLHDMAKLIYAVTPKSKCYSKVDDVAAFDWVRSCKTMEIFEDSELWDLIGNGMVERYSCGMAFGMKKVETLEDHKDNFREMSKMTLKTLTIQTDEEAVRPINVSKTPATYSFVLAGAIQSYGNGDDGRIQLLAAGDFCSNIQWLKKYDSQTQPQAYSLGDTVMLTVSDSQIEHIHPVVRDKLNLLIRQSQDQQARVVRHRHAKVDVHQAVKEASLGIRLL